MQALLQQTVNTICWSDPKDFMNVDPQKHTFKKFDRFPENSKICKILKLN